MAGAINGVEGLTGLPLHITGGIEELCSFDGSDLCDFMGYLGILYFRGALLR